MNAHAQPGPPHLPWEKLEFLCSEAGKEGWGTRRRQEFPKIPRPTLLSEALPSPSSFPGVSWTPEIRPGLWVPGLCPAGRPGLLGSQFQQSALTPPFPEQDMFLVISHQTLRILQQKPQNEGVTVLI